MDKLILNESYLLLKIDILSIYCYIINSICLLKNDYCYNLKYNGNDKLNERKLNKGINFQI